LKVTSEDYLDKSIQYGIKYSTMRKNTTRIERNNYLSHVFDQLCDTDQTYLDTLTAQLAEIQGRCKRHTSPEENRLPTGKDLKNRVQQNKEQNK
jgi:hypothetical protein